MVEELGLSHGEARMNIWKLYVYHAVRGFLFFVPILVLFMQQHGLSLLQVMTVLAVHPVVKAVAPAPVHRVTARFERRTMLVAAADLVILGLILYSIGTSFPTFVAAYVFWAMGMVLGSEAASHLLRDTAVTRRDMEEDVLQKRMKRVERVAVVAAMVVGGVLAASQLAWPLYAATVAAAVLIPVAFSVREPSRTATEHVSLQQVWSDVRSVLREKRERWMVLYTGFATGVAAALFWLLQPFIVDAVSFPLLGVVYAVLYLSWFTGEALVDRLTAWMGRDRVLISAGLGVAAAAGGMAFSATVVAAVFAVGHQFFRGVTPVITAVYRGSSDAVDLPRHGVTAVTGAVTAAIFVGVGWAASTFTLQATIAAAAVTTLVVSGVLLFFLCRRNVL